ncbi:effector-associated constant component EACC1 [Streptomyces malaysiensis]|uniref:effector-associated constant component EACC1 n=1 Tax=Streptomyces malaysiensis TaxID=92644 RepID=UPI00156E7A01|nr:MULTISPECIES: hypothetical protein [unclassified Streptomyces]
MPSNRPGYRITIVDEDPLRARKEARELLAEIADADPDAALDVPRHRTPTPSGTDKGGLSVDTVGVLISAGSLVVAGVQLWLARVPQRTIIARRPDGATLQITGQEAREDDERIERFLSGGTVPGEGEGDAEDGNATAAG